MRGGRLGLIPVVLSLAVTSPRWARADEPAHFTEAKAIITEWEKEYLEPLERQSYWAAVIAIAIGALGIATGVAHTRGKDAHGAHSRGQGTAEETEREKWGKRGWMSVGVLVAVLTVVNNTVFDADFKTLRKTTCQAHDIIEQIRVELFAPRYRTFETQALHDEWWDRFTARVKELIATRRILRDATAFSLERMLSTAYAADIGRRPSWVANPRQDAKVVSFVGTSAGTNPLDARVRSLESAREAARVSLRETLASYTRSRSDVDRVVERLVEAAHVGDTFLEYAQGTYHHYTLLEIDRREVSVMLRIAASRDGVALPRAAADAWRYGKK